MKWNFTFLPFHIRIPINSDNHLHYKTSTAELRRDNSQTWHKKEYWETRLRTRIFLQDPLKFLSVETGNMFLPYLHKSILWASTVRSGSFVHRKRLLPDRVFHNFRNLTTANRRFWTSENLYRLTGSKIGKVLIRALSITTAQKIEAFITPVSSSQTTTDLFTISKLRNPLID